MQSQPSPRSNSRQPIDLQSPSPLPLMFTEKILVGPDNSISAKDFLRRLRRIKNGPSPTPASCFKPLPTGSSKSTRPLSTGCPDTFRPGHVVQPKERPWPHSFSLTVQGIDQRQYVNHNRRPFQYVPTTEGTHTFMQDFSEKESTRAAWAEDLPLLFSSWGKDIYEGNRKTNLQHKIRSSLAAGSPALGGEADEAIPLQRRNRAVLVGPSFHIKDKKRSKQPAVFHISVNDDELIPKKRKSSRRVTKAGLLMVKRSKFSLMDMKVGFLTFVLASCWLAIKSWMWSRLVTQAPSMTSRN